MDGQAQRLSTRAWALTGAFLFAAFWALYLFSSPADLYLDDSGETVTVGALLGIGHPPGYPLHTLLGRLASLLPWATPPWRLNGLAVLWGALLGMGLGLAALRHLLQRGLTPPAAWPAAVLLAMLLALGPVQWHNALGAKGSIYQLNNLLSLGLLALLAAPDTPRLRWLRLFWLGLGLAMAHHYMSQLPLLPAYAWLLWRRGPGLRAALRPAWLLLPGLALYAYLPLRWRLQPELAWGSFAGWQEFWFFFFRLQYAAGELTRGLGTSAAQAWHALGLAWREGSAVLLPLAVLGAWQGRRDARVQALGLGWLAGLAAVSLYLNLKPERLDLMRPYLFPAYLCQAWLAAEGLSVLLRRAGAPWDRTLAVLGLLGALLWGAWQWPAQSLAQHHYASDNAKAVLQALPRNALLLAQGDAIIFPLWHRQRVLRERPDVAVIGLAVLPMDWVRQDLARRHPDLRHPSVRGPIGAESVGRLTQAYLELNRHRPLYAAFNRFDPPIPGWSLHSEGQVWRAVPGEAADSPALRRAAVARLQASSLRGFTSRPLDPRTLTLIVGDRAISYNSLGVAAEEGGSPMEALGYYTQARRLHPENPDFPFNQGNALHALGRLEQAEAAFRAAIAVDPRYVNGWFNLGVTLHQRGRSDGAKAAFRQVLKLDPTKNDVRQILTQLGG
jgi:tetratricopeptide (TPR) repeat protein